VGAIEGVPVTPFPVDLHQKTIQMREILQYLKDHGERLDSEVAAETGGSLENVCLCLSELSDRGDVIMCRTTRFADGRTIEGMLCRASGYFPPASPGRRGKGAKQAEPT
jgi:hypothetical protein